MPLARQVSREMSVTHVPRITIQWEPALFFVNQNKRNTSVWNQGQRSAKETELVMNVKNVG